MKIVEPIKGRDTIKKLGEVLKSYSDRDYTLYMTGLYLGRRISDILPLKVGDVRNKETIYFKEKKTKKVSRLVINKKLKKIFEDYCKGKDDDECLFPPMRGDKHSHISRQQYWYILNKAASEIGYKKKIGCHSLRKTLGRTLYEEGVDIAVISLILGHEDISDTKRYIAVTEDEINSILSKINY